MKCESKEGFCENVESEKFVTIFGQFVTHGLCCLEKVID